MNSIDPSLWTPATITNNYTALQSHFIAKMGKNASFMRVYNVVTSMQWLIEALGLLQLKPFFFLIGMWIFF